MKFAPLTNMVLGSTLILFGISVLLDCSTTAAGLYSIAVFQALLLVV